MLNDLFKININLNLAHIIELYILGIQYYIQINIFKYRIQLSQLGIYCIYQYLYIYYSKFQ